MQAHIPGLSELPAAIFPRPGEESGGRDARAAAETRHGAAGGGQQAHPGHETGKGEVSRVCTLCMPRYKNYNSN